MKIFKKLNNIWKYAKILLLADALILIAWAMLAPIYAIYVQKVWWDLMDASIASGLFALTAWVVTLFSGSYTDKIKNKSIVIIVWYILTWIAFLLYTVANSVVVLFMIQVLIWLWEAISSPAFNALYWNSLKEEYMWFWWWLREFSNQITVAIWAFIWGMLVSLLWFNIVFILMSMLSFSSAIFLFFVYNNENSNS